MTFRNISGSLELPVEEEGLIAPGVDDGLWVVTSINITLLLYQTALPALHETSECMCVCV